MRHTFDHSIRLNEKIQSEDYESIEKVQVSPQ